MFSRFQPLALAQIIFYFAFINATFWLCIFLKTPWCAFDLYFVFLYNIWCYYHPLFNILYDNAPYGKALYEIKNSRNRVFYTMYWNAFLETSGYLDYYQICSSYDGSTCYWNFYNYLFLEIYIWKGRYLLNNILNVLSWLRMQENTSEGPSVIPCCSRQRNFFTEINKKIQLDSTLLEYIIEQTHEFTRHILVSWKFDLK